MCLCVWAGLKSYLLPGEPHPLEALLAIFGAIGADEFEEVVSLQVARLLAAELSCRRSQVQSQLLLQTCWGSPRLPPVPALNS